MTVYYRLIGTGETDANGVASYTYQGTAKGEVDLIASTSNPIGETSLVSETYEIDDCYWIEKGSSTSGMYSISGGTVSLENGVFTLIKGSGTSYFYLNIPKTSLPIVDFVDKDLTVKADVTSLSATSLRCTLFYNDDSWVSVVQDLTTTGLIKLSNHIPSNASQIRIRFDIFGDTDSQAVLENFRLLV